MRQEFHHGLDELETNAAAAFLAALAEFQEEG